MANEPVHSIDPKSNISLHPPSHRGLIFEAEMLSMLRTCISPAYFWWPEWLDAEPARPDRGVVLFRDTNEQAAELSAIHRRAVQAEAACAA
jgi:hypothetical protein